MTRDEALGFLRAHQPMPPEDELTDELIGTFDDVRQFFLANRDSECVPLFLNAFGRGMGCGVYQLVEDVLIQFSPQVVLPHLETALASADWGVLFWCAQICQFFPDPSLIEPLRTLLGHENLDVRFFVAAALAGIDDPRAVVVMKEACVSETDPEILELLRDALRKRAGAHGGGRAGC